MPNCTPSLIASQSRNPRRRTATPVVLLNRARPNIRHTWTPNCPTYFLPIPKFSRSIGTDGNRNMRIAKARYWATMNLPTSVSTSTPTEATRLAADVHRGRDDQTQIISGFDLVATLRNQFQQRLAHVPEAAQYDLHGLAHLSPFNMRSPYSLGSTKASTMTGPPAAKALTSAER